MAAAKYPQRTADDQANEEELERQHSDAQGQGDHLLLFHRPLVEGRGQQQRRVVLGKEGEADEQAEGGQDEPQRAEQEE